MLTLRLNRRFVLRRAHVFAEEADPHGLLRSAHGHDESGLLQGAGHARQVHAVGPALLQSLEPGEVFVEQQEGVVADGDVVW